MPGQAIEGRHFLPPATRFLRDCRGYPLFALCVRSRTDSDKSGRGVASVCHWSVRNDGRLCWPGFRWGSALVTQIIQDRVGITLKNDPIFLLLALIAVHGVVVLRQQAPNPVAVAVQCATTLMFLQGGVHDG